MNEVLFLIHILLVILFLFVALRLGKNYLLVFAVIQTLIANLFVIKQIDLFTKTVTATDVFIIGAIFSQNLLQEYFGKETAIKTIKISFFSMLFFLVMSKIHLLYTPSHLDTTHSAFQNILANSPRIVISSISVFFLTQRLDIYFFSFLKKIFNQKFLPLRMGISSIVVQFIDTVLFSFLALWGIVDHIFDIILFSFIIKSLVIIFSAPFMKFSKYFMKKAYE
ncbi:MAG: hypothetical protein KR126chlam4_00096 [Candidatus Anoxychlamydiales bacterium]|nr:hypothetical protein [Candidatus Anoxychlamydiales bacterium]NGX40279.1 hypothetical protein [Candidatus Anoxychlamydiales bacterium]HEU64789.1 hypothetical protein [Chlamydiota bacterium]